MKRGILFVTFVAATGLVRSADAEQLIVNSYGGPYEDIIRDRIIEPFEKEFGVKVIYDAVGSASQDFSSKKRQPAASSSRLIFYGRRRFLAWYQRPSPEKIQLSLRLRNKPHSKSEQSANFP